MPLRKKAKRKSPHSYLPLWLLSFSLIGFSVHAEVFEQEPAISGTLHFLAQPWVAPCQPTAENGKVPDCEIPKGFGLQKALRLKLAEVSEPGHSNLVYTDFEFAETGQAGRLSVYSVYPHEDSGFPPYLQVRLELTAPVRALCLQSVRFRRPAQVPPQICVAYQESSEGKLIQWGLTLTNRFEAP